MKKNILLIFVFLVCLIGWSQDANQTKTKKAEEAYKEFSYDRAIDHYQELEVSDIDHKRNLAVSFWRRGYLTKAELLFSEIVNTDGYSSADIYNYASILREQKKYEISEEWMLKFSEMNVSDTRGKAYLNHPSAFKQLQVDKGQFVLTNLDINSEQQDFGTHYYGDQIVFASSRESVRSVLRRWNRNGLPFLDTYVARKDSCELKEVQRFSKKVNGKFHEGPVCFNQTGDMMIFTANNYNEKAKDKVTRLKLFTAKLVDGKWTTPEALPFNSPNYSVGHPSISADGKTLYFASDMPGGFGGVDIYKTEIKKDGTFGNVINLGSKLNTEGNEMFPYIHPSEEMLFYSSDGKIGLGGLDVFVAQIKQGGEFGKVINVGSPVNSNRDDFGFILNEEQTSGYLSSNRDGGKGDDDIYHVQMLKPFLFGKLLKVKVTDQNGENLDGAELKLFDSEKSVLKIIKTDDDETYEFVVDDGKNYFVSGIKENYFPDEKEISVFGEEDIVHVVLNLEKDPGLSLYTLITDKKTGEPLEGVQLKIVDNMTGKEEEIITPSTGDFLKPLKEKKLNDRGSYNFILEKEGYLGKTLTYNVVFDREGKYEVHSELNLSLDPIELGEDLSKIIDIKPIYFDLGKSEIRPDAALELDKIVKVMNENPDMVIELGSHTDSRGSPSSNMSLSDRRAKASASYIAERITKPERITGKGYGESKPNIVDARTEGGSEKQALTEYFINSFKNKDKFLFEKFHQLNRRTEFIIIKS
ncbi:MAG: OmpA family protein [Flavobacteriales bacterium]|nr:OmpA family protein [Flavobacteriales bacterium]